MDTTEDMSAEDIVRLLCRALDQKAVGVRYKQNMLRAEAAALRWRVKNRHVGELSTPVQVVRQSADIKENKSGTRAA
jgi:predicted flavoprotein YhiN